jgi:hypothetical protein
MKRFFSLLLFLSLYVCIASAQKTPISNFILKGTFKGKHARAISLFYRNNSGKEIEYKTFLKNGAFAFRGFISSPVNATIMSDIKIKPNGPDVSNAVEVFLTPGNMMISLKENDFEHAILTGSPVHDEWAEVLTLYKPVNKIRDSLFDRLFAIERAGNTPKNHIAHVAVAAEIDKCELQINHIDYQYIVTHPRSYVSAYLLRNLVGLDIRLDSIETAYNSLAAEVKQSLDGKAIDRIILNRKASTVGSIVRMPLGTNLDGSTFNPKTFKITNYLLIYFWAGWANDNAVLKAVYKKYQSRGLKILAVSTEPFKKMWRDSVKKEQIGMWYNIFSAPVANLDTFYNIRQMAPSLILLVDKNYQIIGRYRGSSKLYKMDYGEEPLSEIDKRLAVAIGDY